VSATHSNLFFWLPADFRRFAEEAKHSATPAQAEAWDTIIKAYPDGHEPDYKETAGTND
jgi:hypothetical protein